MKITYLLKTIFWGLFFSIHAFASTVTDDSLLRTLHHLEVSFNEAEQVSPAEGYQIIIKFDKSTNEFCGFLESRGTRVFGTPLEIPSVKTCLLCMRHDDLQFDDMKIFYSFNDRFIIAPKIHVPHWFAKEKLDRHTLLELQYALMKCATHFCILIEELFPEKNVFSESYSFEIFCGYHAGQNIPHLSIKIPLKGHITKQEWKEIKNKVL